MIESELLSKKNTFSKEYTENWPKEIFVVDSGLKTNYWTYKIKYLNEEEIIRSFLEKRIVAE